MADALNHLGLIAYMFGEFEEARKYCEKLAKSHYENFLVAGAFCPKPLRQHFYNVYAYCRISDDLSDEIGDPAKSLILLDWDDRVPQPMHGRSRPDNSCRRRCGLFVGTRRVVRESGFD